MPDATTLTWEAKMTQIIHSYYNGEIDNLLFLEPRRSISIMFTTNRKHFTYLFSIFVKTPSTETEFDSSSTGVLTTLLSMGLSLQFTHRREHKQT